MHELVQDYYRRSLFHREPPAGGELRVRFAGTTIEQKHPHTETNTCKIPPKQLARSHCLARHAHSRFSGSMSAAKGVAMLQSQVQNQVWILHEAVGIGQAAPCLQVGPHEEAVGKLPVPQLDRALSCI